MQNSRQSVYLETTVPSYLTAKDSKDVVMLGHQIITRDWWDLEAPKYDLYVSELVLEEAGHGDTNAAKRRLELLAGLQVLPNLDEAITLSKIYVDRLLIPRSASADALHLALATLYKMDYLLTWNCRHIAKGTVRRILPDINGSLGLPTPAICTPEELHHENEYLD